MNYITIRGHLFRLSSDIMKYTRHTPLQKCRAINHIGCEPKTCDCEKPKVQSTNYIQYLLLLGILIVILLMPSAESIPFSYLISLKFLIFFHFISTLTPYLISI